MNELSKKSQKFIQIVKHYTRPVPAAQENGNWNYTPSCVDNSHYREIIRRKVRPFTPQPVAPKVVPVTPAANHPKLIDFALASLTEAHKREHAATMHDMIKRLSSCWNRAIDHNLNADGLYYLFESYRWQCPVTGVTHSWRTPLSIEFIVHPFAGGRIALFNIRPRYNGLLPGEYRWRGKPSLAELAASA